MATEINVRDCHKCGERTFTIGEANPSEGYCSNCDQTYLLHRLTGAIDILQDAMCGYELSMEHCNEMVSVGRVKNVQFGGYGNHLCVMTDKGTATIGMYDRIELRVPSKE